MILNYQCEYYQAAILKLYQRNVLLLALSQALMMSGISLLITTAAFVGADLAPRHWLSTLPLATLYIAMMLTSIPASLIMERTGRKKGFMLVTLFSIAGATIATIAIIKGEFWLFVMGTTFIGVFNGFGNYFRFAAAEAVDEAQGSRGQTRTGIKGSDSNGTYLSTKIIRKIRIRH